MAVVTGGANGIGKAVAQRLADRGARVAVIDRDGEAAAAVAKAVGGISIQTDLGDPAATRSVIPAVVEQLGPPQILVNDAGFQRLAPIDEFPEATLRAMFEVMLTAPFLLTQAIWPHMRRLGWGRIVNMGSIHSLVASPYKVAYVTAKHGLIGLTRAQAVEGGPLGITANAVCPSYTRTALVIGQVQAQAELRGISEDAVIGDVMLRSAAVKRLIEPDEVADLAVYLCSKAASAITGSVFSIDGGWTAQ